MARDTKDRYLTGQGFRQLSERENDYSSQVTEAKICLPRYLQEDKNPGSGLIIILTPQHTTLEIPKNHSEDSSDDNYENGIQDEDWELWCPE